MASDLKKKKVWLKLIRLQIIDVQCCNQRIKESSEGSQSPGKVATCNVKMQLAAIGQDWSCDKHISTG